LNFVGDDPIDVTTLPLYPLSYAESTRKSLLRTRGKKLWQCRRWRYVQYEGIDVEGIRHPVSLY
jgi:hypothetical protein